MPQYLFIINRFVFYVQGHHLHQYVGYFPGRWPAAHIADPDVHFFIFFFYFFLGGGGGGSTVVSFHSWESVFINFFHTNLGLLGGLHLPSCSIYMGESFQG